MLGRGGGGGVAKLGNICCGYNICVFEAKMLLT